MDSFKNYRTQFVILGLILTLAFYLLINCVKYNSTKLIILKENLRIKELKNKENVQKNNHWLNEQFVFQPLNDFYKAWDPYQGVIPEKVLSDWDLLSQKLAISIINKEIISQKEFSTESQIRITLEGAASKIIDWLGQIEEKYPLIHLDSTKISISESNLQLELIASLLHF